MPPPCRKRLSELALYPWHQRVMPVYAGTPGSVLRGGAWYNNGNLCVPPTETRRSRLPCHLHRFPVFCLPRSIPRRPGAPSLWSSAVAQSEVSGPVPGQAFSAMPDQRCTTLSGVVGLRVRSSGQGRDTVFWETDWSLTKLRCRHPVSRKLRGR